MTALDVTLPKGPVLGWASFLPRFGTRNASIADWPNRQLVTSGRAAIYQALLQSDLPPGSGVLVPTYHCPTMVAPVVQAGLNVHFVGIGEDGLPQLESIDAKAVQACRAIIVAHYFGFPKSLASVRAWCDERGLALIEDCAHSYYGNAGERPVGGWGDFATASVTKFFPVSEGGLLVRASGKAIAAKLRRAGLKAQIKAWVDILELAARHRRLAGINTLLHFVFSLKRGDLNPSPATVASAPQRNAMPSSSSVDAMMRDCDMQRVAQKPVFATRWLFRLLPSVWAVNRRRGNFSVYLEGLSNCPGARPIVRTLPLDAVPYVFPLWVDDSDRVYLRLRELKMPVHRWDRVWPSTPQLTGDMGPLWSKHVLQLLCHQALSQKDVAQVCAAVVKLLDGEEDIA